MHYDILHCENCLVRFVHVGKIKFFEWPSWIFKVGLYGSPTKTVVHFCIKLEDCTGRQNV